LSNSLSQEFTPILDYFKDYYIGRMLYNNVRRQPLFNPAMWSCYLRTINNECRTNNFAEAAHRKLNREFGADHPSLWKFIDGLRMIQKSVDQLYEQFLRGDQHTPKRKKYTLADERILEVVNDFKNREILEFVRGIAYNFVMD